MAADKKDDKMAQPEVDVLLRGMLSQPGVEGFMVFNEEGIPIKWSSTGFSKPNAPVSPAPIPPAVVHHAALLGGLASKARMTMRNLVGDADGEVSMLRLHTTQSEIIVAPSAEVTLVVVQKAAAGAGAPGAAAAAPPA